MTEDLARFIEERYRDEYERGRLKAGYEAALFCLKNDQPLPPWLVPMVENALKRDFLTSEGRGRGQSKAITASRKAALREFILSEVQRLSRFGIPKVKAFEAIAQDLSGHDKKPWTAEMVKAEFYRSR